MDFQTVAQQVHNTCIQPELVSLRHSTDSSISTSARLLDIYGQPRLWRVHAQSTSAVLSSSALNTIP